VASTPSVSMSRDMSFANISGIPSIIPSSSRVEESQNRSDEEENTIHNPERKSSLQHTTLFICAEVKSVQRNTPKKATNLVTIPSCNMCAVLMGDSTEFVDSCDESADETEVDECDEHGVRF